MVTTEPINLREWKAREGSQPCGRLFTCGRPGRATYDRARVVVGEDIIDLWRRGLPEAGVLHIVSLLGSKRGSFSEFGYYPFKSSIEPGIKPTFEEWLNQRYGHRFVVYEFPTVDAQGLPRDVLGQAAQKVLSCLEAGHITVVIDSAGAERTSRVCEEIGYIRLPWSFDSGQST